jgi:hypothetical protein
MNQLLPRLFSLAFLATTIIIRLVPHPPHVSSVAALALFAGCYLSIWQGAALTLGAMAISDLIGHYLELSAMGFYDRATMMAVYFSMGIVAVIGRALRGRENLVTVPVAAFVSTVVFFLITNFVCWLDPLMAYPQTAEGLVACYAAGLAFLGDTNPMLNLLLGNLFFSGVFFGLYRVARATSPNRSTDFREPAPVRVEKS